MGIQIYIKKAALDTKGIEYFCETDVLETYCGCGASLGQCNDCGVHGETFTHELCFVVGLQRTMHDLGDVVWHDANHWGSSRPVLLEFIETHNLVKDKDWYEC